MNTIQLNEYSSSYKCTAVQKNYKEFYSWIHKNCDDWNLDTELKNKIDMTAEEIFANIVFYAYPAEKGYIEVNMLKNGGNITLRFTDEGTAYNPLERPDPDITLAPERRTPGGLGIFMVKKTASSVNYIRKDNKNILTVEFQIND